MSASYFKHQNLQQKYPKIYLKKKSAKGKISCFSCPNWSARQNPYAQQTSDPSTEHHYSMQKK
uniref:Uncharacterized protein n=1 Tax=Cyprinodon variegatus TaxID=28743 RepID=A0A3Q2DN78_CYPVA